MAIYFECWAWDAAAADGMGKEKKCKENKWIIYEEDINFYVVSEEIKIIKKILIIARQDKTLADPIAIVSLGCGCGGFEFNSLSFANYSNTDLKL